MTLTFNVTDEFGREFKEETKKEGISQIDFLKKLYGIYKENRILDEVKKAQNSSTTEYLNYDELEKKVYAD